MRIITILSIFTSLFFLSCEDKTTENKKTITGVYHVEKFPDGKKKVFIFCDEDLQILSIEHANLYSFQSNSKYYFEGKNIYTCKPYIQKCEKDQFEKSYEVISVDTINNDQIVKLKSDNNNLILRKTIKFEYVD